MFVRMSMSCGALLGVPQSANEGFQEWAGNKKTVEGILDNKFGNLLLLGVDNGQKPYQLAAIAAGRS